ncbi:hypothetical protein [Agaribacterium sp. ZY112]|uniref:hypothetical protein n=1 Tax=Agaribacterium sp. ZY112 TaxID=3233574 RepID=UPI0035246EAC
MNIDNEYINEIGELVLRCRKVVQNEWDVLALVFDTAEGHTANSGFLYYGDKIRPISAGIDGEPLLLDLKIEQLRKKIAEDCGAKFKQVFIQMEKKSGKIKVDFEFEDSSRWRIVPSKLKEMREALRPKF